MGKRRIRKIKNSKGINGEEAIMAKDEIKKLLDQSKKALEKEQDDFSQSIKKDLDGFKKKTLDQI